MTEKLVYDKGRRTIVRCVDNRTAEQRSDEAKHDIVTRLTMLIAELQGNTVPAMLNLRQHTIAVLERCKFIAVDIEE